MRLGIDLTWMEDKPAGVGTMAGEVVDELNRRGDINVVLFRSETIGHGPLKHLRLARAIRMAKLDVLWQIGGWLPLILPRGLTTIQTVHDLISFDHPEWFPQRGLSRWWSHHMRVARAIRRAQVIHAVSRWTGWAVTRWFRAASSRIVIAHQGVMVPPIESIAPSGCDRPFVLVLGTVEPRKNIEVACRAFALFAHEHSEPSLIIAGKTGWRAGLSPAAINDLSSRFPGRIHRLEYVDEATKWALIKDASVLLMVSHAEGFGRPIVEAMALGTPVIAADNSAMQEIAHDAAIMVPPDDEQKIAHALRRVIYDPTRSAKLVELGYARARLFTVEKMVDEVLRTIALQEG